MATRIAKVFEELPEQRGPDLCYRIFVPEAWLTRGDRISLSLPRLLPCARCEGGGCDRCHRKGAFAVRESSDEAAPLTVRLAAGAPEQAQMIRIPERGAPADDPSQPAGCLMLRVEPGELSAGVSGEQPALAGRPTKLRLPAVWLLLPILTLLVWWLLRTFAG